MEYIHDRLALKVDRWLQGAHVPEWMTRGKTTLIQKDPIKGTVPNNYRPITFLPMMRKIFITQIREEICYSLTSCRLFSEEQKWYRKWSRGTAELLYIDKNILNERKTTLKILAMAWIDYKKAYMVLQSWIINCFQMYKISDEVINFIGKPWKPGEWNWEQGGEVKILIRIFQGDAPSPLLIIIAIMSLNHMLRKCNWTQTK